jgi:2-keto-4-pentenoate hydratase/2-oxohepta-3-ene-1,7-dioic acid hydratase in catechol pathway
VDNPYQHRDLNAEPIILPLGKVVCVGRNYLDHIQELNNAVPEQALLFMKPSTALCYLSSPVFIPKNHGACHNELEIAVLLDRSLKNASLEQAKNAIWGYGLALDLTLRDVQGELKSQGHPWERAKSFDASCPISPFVAHSQILNDQPLQFALQVNDELRQQGSSENMIRDIASLIVEISHSFTLLPGDIVLTGTPKGVGALQVDDKLTVSLAGHFSLETSVI